MSIQPFQKQPIWQMSHELAKEVSCLTRLFPREDSKNLAYQMNQSSIALYERITGLYDDGSSRKRTRGLTHSYNALRDLKQQYNESLGRKYISQNTSIEDKMIEIEVQINYLMKSNTA